jgi:(p)ppGpp synthase/HD superfamily hydrolase
MPDRTFLPSFLGDLPLARGALVFARELHHGQRRSSDEAPFILHPLEVASLLHVTGHSEAAVAAGILHDRVEDTSIEVDAIRQRFGPEVADLVAAMTEDPGIEPYEERKAALPRQIAASGEEAIAICAADKVKGPRAPGRGRPRSRAAAR